MFKLIQFATRVSTAARLLGLGFRISLGALMSLSCERCLLSGRGLCDGPITRQQESCRVCVSLRVNKCDNALYIYSE